MALQVEAKQRRDRKLMILTGVCLLIPPLWPLALRLALFLIRHHDQAWSWLRRSLSGGRIAVGRRARFGDGLAGSAAFLIRTPIRSVS